MNASFRPILEKRPLPPVISEAVPEVRRMMKKGQPVKLMMTLDRTINSYIVNTPTFTAEDAAEYHARRIAKKKAEMEARKKGQKK